MHELKCLIALPTEPIKVGLNLPKNDFFPRLLPGKNPDCIDTIVVYLIQKSLARESCRFLRIFPKKKAAVKQSGTPHPFYGSRAWAVFI
jgi:hypothetical protein